MGLGPGNGQWGTVGVLPQRGVNVSFVAATSSHKYLFVFSNSSSPSPVHRFSLRRPAMLATVQQRRGS